MIVVTSNNFKQRSYWVSLANKEYEMSAYSVVVEPAVTWSVRRIIKQYSNKSFSSGLSQRVFPNGGSQGADVVVWLAQKCSIAQTKR